MAKVELRTERLSPSKGPYSHGVRVGNTLYISGQLSRDPQGNIVGKGDIAAQAEQVIQNLKAVLEGGGASLDNVVKLTMFVTDITQLSKILEVRNRHFKPVYPAATAVQVSALAQPELMLEIEAVAVIE